jgi:hypothetical protein
MIYLELFGVFFKIGLFGFGGGYAMIPLLEGEISAHGWLPVREFADIVAISQMTPGPIMVNAATYIGYRVAGFLGSAIATFGVSLPSLVLVMLVAHSIRVFKESVGGTGNPLWYQARYCRAHCRGSGVLCPGIHHPSTGTAPLPGHCGTRFHRIAWG